MKQGHQLRTEGDCEESEEREGKKQLSQKEGELTWEIDFPDDDPLMVIVMNLKGVHQTGYLLFFSHIIGTK